MTAAPALAAPARATPAPLLKFGASACRNWDQWQRYTLVARLLAHLLRDAPRPVRVLDVGSNVLDLLNDFLDPESCQVVRCDYESRPGDLQYVQLTPGATLPFGEGDFDAVVALDVLEHVPPAEREAFLADCLRVASLGVVVTCPDGRPDVERAEAVAAAAYAARHGRPHPFLLEHHEFGLPTEAEVRGHFAAIGAPLATYGSAPLGLWLGHLLRDEWNAENPGGPAGGSYRDPRPLPAGDRPYRRVYLAVKGFDAGHALEPLPPSAFAPAPEDVAGAGDPADPAALANALAAQFEAARRVEVGRLSAEHAAEAEALRARAEADRVAIHQLSLNCTVAAAWRRSVAASRAWKLTAPLRVLRNWVRPSRISAGAFHPIHALEPAGDGATWLATGFDPQFLVPCDLPAGWLHVRAKLRRKPGRGEALAERLEIYADHGDGVRAENRLCRLNWGEELDQDLFVFLPRPALALRIDPTDGPGRFIIDEWTVSSVAGPRAWRHALREKWKVVRSHGCAGPAFGRMLRQLGRGEWRTVRNKLFRGLHDRRMLRPEGEQKDLAYAEWRRRRALTADGRDDLRAEVLSRPDLPTFSVVMPVCDPPIEHLRKAVESVRNQLYPHWQLCAVDDASTSEEVKAYLRQAASEDSRVSVEFRESRGGISAASNQALAAAAGDFVALVDHDDEIAEHALMLFAREVQRHPRADFLYSDEDKIEQDGTHVDPFLKPDWSPEFFQTCMYTCHLGAYRTSVVRAVGGFRPEFDFAQDYDLALRVVASIERSDGAVSPAGGPLSATHTDRIRHIPEVLYHWRKSPQSTASGHEAKPQAERAARRAVQAYLDETGRAGRVEPGPVPGYHSVRHAIQGSPLVSVVIPTAGKSAEVRGEMVPLILHCVRSIRRASSYGRVEVVVADNGDLTPDLIAELDALRVQRVTYDRPGPFNLAAKLNQGCRAASGDYLVLLNDDTEVLSPDWLERMLEFAQQPGVGAVGAKLLFPDGRLQHVGVTLLEARPGHPFYTFPGNYPGYYCGSIVPRNYSAVTGACVMAKAEHYWSVGGFGEEFPLNYNDVDFCLKLLERGLRTVWTPYARLMHFESVSKEGVLPGELEAFLAKWGGRIAVDPYYHPLLTMDQCDYRLGSVW